MSLPSSNDVHVDAILTNISVSYQQVSPSVADQVFPMVPVKKQSDKYFTYDLADWNRSSMQIRQPGTESAGAGWRVSSDTYFCDIYALHKDIDDAARGNQDDPMDLDKDAVMFLQEQNKLKRDVQWAADFFTTGVWTGSTTGTDIVPGTLWSASNSTPVNDVRDERRAVRLKTGIYPNVLVIGGAVFDALCDNSDVVDRIKYSQKGIVTTDLLAALFQVDKVIVADLMQVTSNEGAGTTVTAAVFGKHALLCYVPPRPGLRTPAAGYTFEWSGQNGSIGGQRILSFRMPALKSDRIEIETCFDQKLIGANLGVFFNGAVA